MQTRPILSLVFILLLCAASTFGQSFRFVSLDVPGSTATWAMGIGPGGQIVGGYMSSSDGMEHGFLYSNGTFTTIEVPGSLAGLPDDTKLEAEVSGINPAGDMVGDYFAPPGAPGAPACLIAYSPPCQRGFLYRHGQFSNVLVPGHAGTIPSAITPDGSIYGCMHDQNLTSSMYGFVRTQSGDYRIFDYKTMEVGGGELANPTESHPRSMNNSATPDGSTVVGLYVPPGATRAHGFKVQNGILTDYMFPDATVLATQIWGINPGGDFVGLYRNSTGVHGFLQPSDGSAAIPIDYVDPDSEQQAVQTQAMGINPAGVIVGVYHDVKGGEHGYVALRIDN